MATLIWTGSAPAVAQVTDFVFAGTWEATDVITLTMGGVTVSTTAGSATTATVVSTLVTTWNNLSSTTHPMFAEITASVVTSTTFRLTGDTAGKPFAVTIATTETGGGAADAQTIDGAATSTGVDATACSGPNHWDSAGNWSTGAVPVDSDDVYIERSSVDIKYGLANTSIDLTSLNIAQSYTGKIGLPDYNTDGTSYYEYREKYLKLGTATTVNVGRGEGQGSGRIKLHLGTNAATVNVEGTGSPAESGLPALLIQGSNASNVLNITQGNVGLAVEVSTTAQFPTLRVGSESNPAGDVTLVCGAGCTLTTINQAGGNVTVETNVTTWTKTAGSTSTILGTATITTLTQDGSGTHYQQSSGTVTTATVRGANAVFDKARDLRALTITNSTFTGGAAINDPNKTVTFTSPMTTDQASLARHVLGLAPFSLQRT